VKPLPPVPLSPGQLSVSDRKDWDAVAPKLEVSCDGEPASLDHCDPVSCRTSAAAIDQLIGGILYKHQGERLVASHHQRFGPQGPEIPLDVPIRGPADSVVTVVEFADFASRDFRETMPELDAELAKRKDTIRFASIVVFGGAERDLRLSELAARAALAADAQGKYFEMRGLLAVRDRGSTTDGAVDLARSLGLDLARFRADMGSQAITDRLARHAKIATELGVFATPAVFINRRRFDGQQELGPWIDLELIMVRDLAPTKPQPASD
jgi:protein-disulfide isomerase